MIEDEIEPIKKMTLAPQNDETWICAECFLKKYIVPEDFDWRKVPFIYSKCQICGNDPIIFADIEKLKTKVE